MLLRLPLEIVGIPGEPTAARCTEVSAEVGGRRTRKVAGIQGCPATTLLLLQFRGTGRLPWARDWHRASSLVEIGVMALRAELLDESETEMACRPGRRAVCGYKHIKNSMDMLVSHRGTSIA